MVQTEKDLIDCGFNLIGTKSNGLKIYARKTPIDDSSIVLYKVTSEGELLGAEFLEVEILKFLMESGLL